MQKLLEQVSGAYGNYTATQIANKNASATKATAAAQNRSTEVLKKFLPIVAGIAGLIAVVLLVKSFKK